MGKLPTPEEVRTEAEEAWRDWNGYGEKAMAVLRAYGSGRLVDRFSPTEHEIGCLTEREIGH